MKAKLKNVEVERRYQQVTTCAGYALTDDFVGVAINPLQMILCIILSAILLAVTFLLTPINFWLCLSITALLLAGLAILLGGNTIEKRHLDLEAALIGIAAAIFLYALFWAGHLLLELPLFARLGLAQSLAALYSLKEAAPIYLVIAVLLLITSPGEEIFWRGFVQRGITQALGTTKGWLLSAVLYALVHIVTLNPLLVLSALISGLIWGYMYQKQRHIVACIISHALWAVAIFIVFPLI